jgi:hypothetical protein
VGVTRLVWEMVDPIGLGEVAELRPDSPSLRVRQRVSLVVALVLSPD